MVIFVIHLIVVGLNPKFHLLPVTFTNKVSQSLYWSWWIFLVICLIDENNPWPHVTLSTQVVLIQYINFFYSTLEHGDDLFLLIFTTSSVTDTKGLGLRKTADMNSCDTNARMDFQYHAHTHTRLPPHTRRPSMTASFTATGTDCHPACVSVKPVFYANGLCLRVCVIRARDWIRDGSAVTVRWEYLRREKCSSPHF